MDGSSDDEPPPGEDETFCKLAAEQIRCVGKKEAGVVGKLWTGKRHADAETHGGVQEGLRVTQACLHRVMAIGEAIPLRTER